MQRRSSIRPCGSNPPGVAAVTVVIALVLVVALLFVAIHVAAKIKREDVRASWTGAIGTFDEVMQRHPPTKTNTKALEIERLATTLGVDIVPRPVEDRPRPDEAAKAEFEAIKKQVFSDYLEPMLERPLAGRLDAPPEILAEYLARHDGSLTALRAALAPGQPAPVWHSDMSKLNAAPIPNLLGSIDLVKLMTAAALERLSAGDEPVALEYLDASWQLADDLRDSPILINQLVSIAETRMMLGVLRHVDSVPDRWLERLEFDYRGPFLRSMKYAGWVWLYLDADDLGGTTWWQKATRSVVAGPYDSYCLAYVSDAWRERIENLERVESICDYDLSDRQADLNIPIPRWNVIGEIVVPNLANAIRRLARLELDVELTRLTVEARQSWPSAEATTVSLACNADSWESTVRDGELHIALSRSIEWTDQLGVLLPTEAVLRPRAGEAMP